MKQRPISTPRQLGAAIYDARTAAGMTQATLASRAGVSRKWLIGLEQGARTGAELGKILGVLHALGLAIHLSEAQEVKGSSSQEDNVRQPESGLGDPIEGQTHTSDNLHVNSAALEAIQKMRGNLTVNSAALEAIQKMRGNLTVNTATLDAIQKIRGNLTVNTATLDAIDRKSTRLNSSHWE